MALTDNLISFWAIDEASGNRADSVVATANTLTDNNTVTNNTGKVYPLAGQFTAANTEFLSRTDAAGPTLSVGGTSFTFTAWVWLDNLSDDRIIIGKDDTGTNREYLLYFDVGAGTFGFSTWTASGGVGRVDLTSFGGVGTNTWYFVMAKSDQTQNFISQNDGVINSVGAVNAGWDGAAPFNIGARNSGGLPFNGRIGPVGFWKRALSAAEITQLYNAGAGLTYAAMIGWGKLLGQELNRLVVP